MNAVTGLAAAGAAVALAAALEQLDAAVAADGSPRTASVGVARGLPRVAKHGGAARHLVVGVVAACLAMLVGSPVFGAMAGMVAAGASVARVRRAAQGQARACDAATPALARVLADALRGGTSIRSALIGAADDRSVPEALRRAVAAEAHVLAVGGALVPVVASLADRGGASLRLLCGTIALHVESGGRLSTELERLATSADEARRVEQDRLAATAQARATVRVVGALPLLALGGAQLASPGFLGQVASNPIALALLLLGLVLEVVAFMAARAIVGPVR